MLLKKYNPLFHLLMISIVVFLINFVFSEVNDDDLFEFTFIHTNDGM